MTFATRRKMLALTAVIGMLALMLPTAAWSMGKNGGGALYIHFDPSIQFIPDDVPAATYFNQFTDACPAIDPLNCELAYLTDCHYGADFDPDLNPLFPTPRYIAWVCAVFPESTCVELSEVTFKIGEITGTVDMFAWATFHPEAGSGGLAYGVTTGNFPHDTGSEVTLYFDPPLTSHAVPLCYFAGAPIPNGTTALDGPITFKDAAGHETEHIYDPECPYATAFWLMPGGGGCNPSLGDDPYMHACCLEDGDLGCVMMSEEDCAQYGGVFLTDYDTCDPNPCNEGPIAACCYEDPQYPQGITACVLVNEIECQVMDGVFHLEWESCDPNPCNGELAACCLRDEELDCVLISQIECDYFEGVWLEGLGSCDPNPCNEGPIAACCIDEGEMACILTNSIECQYLGGEFHEEWDFCEPNPCNGPLGACCFVDTPAELNCAVMNEFDCIELHNGTWFEGLTCDPNPCAEAVCCLGEECAIMIEAECLESQGVWISNLTSCDGGPCRIRACCIDEECTLTYGRDCDGVWHEDEIACDPNPCYGPYGPRKTCCIGPNCTIVTEIECISSGGYWDAGLSTCRPVNPCTQHLVRACCVDNVCELTTMEECVNMQGDWLDSQDSCDPNPCGGIVTGKRACCLPTGGCMLLEETACDDAGGDWIPGITTCTGGDIGNPCRLRVCCDGLTPLTTLMRRDECEAAGGDWLEDIGHFDPNPCDPATPVNDTSWGKIKTLYRPTR